MKRAGIHKKYYDDLQVSINGIEERFFEVGIKAVRKRDVRRFKEYRECLDTVEIEGSRMTGMKRCLGGLRESKKGDDFKGRLDKIKGDLYTCVDKEYRGKSYTLLAKVGFEDCLKRFEKDIFRLI